MKFIYLLFISLWSIVCIGGIAVSTVQLCKSNKSTEIVAGIVLWLFFAGVLAQFVVVGVQVIGG